MNLELSINRLSLDVGCDQGYGSERSPEDDFPPILSIPYKTFQTHLQTPYQMKSKSHEINENDFSFVREGKHKIYIQNIFEKAKNYRALQ